MDKVKGLYLRGNIWWMRFEIKGVRIHRSTKETSLVRAQAILIALKDKMQGSKNNAPKCFESYDTRPIPNGGKLQLYEKQCLKKLMGLREAIDLTKTEKLRQTKNWNIAKYCLEVIYGILGNISLDTIDRKTFRHLKHQLQRRGLANITINKYFSFLNIVMTYVYDEYDVDCPMRIIGVRLKARSRRIRVFSAREEMSIRAWLENHKIGKHYAGWKNRDLVEIFDVLMATGMRRGELFSFRVELVRENAIILDDHKTMDSNGERSVPLNKTAKTIIMDRISRYQLNPGDRVFAYSKNAFSRLWKRMREELGYAHDTEFVVHATRHTFASRLAEKGASIYEVSKVLGHTTVATTERYAHLFNHHLVKTVCLLDD